MNRIFSLLLVFVLLFTAAGCDKKPDATIHTESNLFGDVIEQPYWDTMPGVVPDNDDIEYPDETVDDEYVEYPDETIEDEFVEFPDETVVVDPYEEPTQPSGGNGTADRPQSSVAQPLTWSKLNAIPIANGNMTEDQLREICVDFMRLQLSFAWTPSDNLSYTVAKKQVNLDAGSVYGGLPYVSSTFGNLYKAMEYYDEKTGILDTHDTNILKIIGNQCSASAYWAWSRVSNAISFGGTSSMLEKYGCLRLGSYTYDSGIGDFHKETIRTANICTANGEQTMYESYALLKAADGISMYTGGAGHVRMVAEKAHVVRNADGTINGERSSITFLDQVDTWKSDTQANGKPIRIQGNLDVTVSFASLYKAGYLPFRIPELAGKDPVEKGAASLSHSGGTVTASGLQGSTINTNYPLSDITITVTDKSGKQVYCYTKPLTSLNIYSYVMSSAVEKSELNKYADGTYKIMVSCRVGTGEKLTAYNGTLTK